MTAGAASPHALWRVRTAGLTTLPPARRGVLEAGGPVPDTLGGFTTRTWHPRAGHGETLWRGVSGPLTARALRLQDHVIIDLHDGAERVAGAWLDGAHIHSFEVAPARRGEGLGSALMPACTALGGTWLWVEPDNAPAARLYARHLGPLGEPVRHVFRTVALPMTTLQAMGTPDLARGLADGTLSLDTLADSLDDLFLRCTRTIHHDATLATWRAAETAALKETCEPTPTR